MIVRSVELQCLKFLKSRWCRPIALGVFLCLVFGSSPGIEARSIPPTRQQNPQNSTQDTSQQDTSRSPEAAASDRESEKVATPSEDAGKQIESHSETPESELEDALEEYKIQIGRVTMTLSGAADTNGSRHFTKDYHGNFYEYLRNDALDALPHQVRQAAGTKSILRRNQFGFNLTG